MSCVDTLRPTTSPTSSRRIGHPSTRPSPTGRPTAEALATLQDPPVPTLYLHGADDGALGIDIFGDPAQHLPAAGSEFEIVDGAGHFLHLEQPERIAATILGWLAG